ncbi:MAG: CRISPR-associated endonuclease Cas2 [Streptosporangiaceae bacterium]
MRGPVIVCYDVFDDRRQARVRSALSEVADRFQQSGWLIPGVAGFDADRTAAALGGLLAPADRLRIYEPCPECARAARTLPDPGDLLAAAWVAH